MTSLRNISLLALSAFVLLPFFASAAEPQAKSKVTMTFVANEGILVAGSEVRLLVDGLFGKSYSIFQTPNADTIAKLTTATAPFDRLTAALVTHKDTDHVNAAYVSAHLVRDINCALVAPAEMVDLVRSQPDFAKFEQRIHAIPPVESETETNLKEGRLAHAMIQYLHPKLVLLAHLTTKNATAEKALLEKVGGLPPIVPLDTLMRTYAIEKIGNTLRIE